MRIYISLYGMLSSLSLIFFSLSFFPSLYRHLSLSLSIFLSLSSYFCLLECLWKVRSRKCLGVFSIFYILIKAHQNISYIPPWYFNWPANFIDPKISSTATLSGNIAIDSSFYTPFKIFNEILIISQRFFRHCIIIILLFQWQRNWGIFLQIGCEIQSMV